MQKYDIYKDISCRTNGDMYIGVVGPVRTGKSTFIRKFLEELVIPNINDKFKKQISTDEMPQSADGKTIMTTQPSFVPSSPIKVTFKNKASASVRLVDCVGYSVEGASGYEDNGKERLVKTPWEDKEISFEKASEIGTKKVINDYSTIGIVVTTDGSFTDIPRENYVKAENKVINELKEINKPFIVLLNSAHPNDSKTIEICEKIERENNVTVICENVAEIDKEGINLIIEKVLYEFPMCNFDISIPKWMQVLSKDDAVIKDLITRIKESSKNIRKMKDFSLLTDSLSESEYFENPVLNEIKLGEGICEYSVEGKADLFYKTLSNICGEAVEDEYSLISVIKKYSFDSKKYEKIKDALGIAEENGYGIVVPQVEDMQLSEPTLVKQNGKYGIKFQATAPSYHIMKVDVETEVSPLVGSEKQGEELVNNLVEKFEENPKTLWETDILGKTLNEIVTDGVVNKIESMPKDTQNKMRKTVSRIVNEKKGGVICIII